MVDCAVWRGFVQELLKNPNLKLPYAEDDITAESWLERGIKTLFTQENIAHIYKVTANIGQSNADANIDAVVDERMAQKVEKYNAKFQELRSKWRTWRARRRSCNRD